ncbi:MAG: hypothetical protein V3W45_06650, partial [Sedimentisphaerales bacterium]
MARWFSRLSRLSRLSRRRDRVRRWIYGISALLIIILVVFICGRYPFSREEATESSVDIGMPEMGETIPPVSASEPEPKLLEVEITPTAESNPEVAQLIDEAMELLNTKPAKVIEARDRLNETLPLAMSSRQRAFVKEQLSKLADKWLFSRTIYAEGRLSGAYEVKPGDRLSTIGKQFKVPYE